MPQAMLAKGYAKKYADFANGVYSSPKLDGIRCLAVISTKEVKLWTRGGKEITTMNHIREALLPMIHWVGGVDVVLDGELYYHEKAADNFQDVMKAFKKYRPGVSELLNYHVFDLVDVSMTAKERLGFYSRLLNKLRSSKIVIVPQTPVLTEEEVNRLDESHLASGYEGSIVKNCNSMYVPNLRSSDMLKLKQFQESEFTIIDVIPMDNQPESGKAVLASPKGQFNATPSMNMEQRAEFLRNKDDYIGLRATIKYQGFTDKGLPRIAVLKPQ